MGFEIGRVAKSRHVCDVSVHKMTFLFPTAVFSCLLLFIDDISFNKINMKTIQLQIQFETENIAVFQLT